VYFLARSDDAATVRTAEAHGYRLTDVRVTLGCEVSTAHVALSGTAGVRPATQDDLPELEQIAGTAHRDSRFYFDGRFDVARCDAMYRAWIRNSVNGFADAVFVTGDSSRPCGYITCDLDREAKVCGIGLVAVHESSRRAGVGGRLVDGALAWCASTGAGRLTVVTQARNVVAQRLYQRRGFRTQSAELYYHKWFDKA
jgi:GNAT superfamily N-acetyltransferase